MPLFHDEFFPTPAPVIAKMLARVSKDARYFLEPSAGKGDIAEGIKRLNDRYNYVHRVDGIDCIEIVPDLAAILREKDFPVVGADWLTYSGVSFYDAIVANPPFSEGDKHLLRMWEFLHHGEIVCLLNAETVRNPYTEARKRLVALIAEHGDIEELGACFTTAERPTDAEVVLVYLRKESDDDRMELWADNTSAERQPEEGEADPQWVAIRDTLGNMVHYYDMANQHMLTAFQHLRKASVYLQANGHSYVGQDYDKIVPMALDNVNRARAEFSKQHRKRCWQEVFNMMDFHKWLDKKQREQFLRDIERESTIPFTKENIKGTLENIWLQRQKLFEMSVANVFDELTRYYKGNTSWHEGWKTNDNYKVNKKIIFPYGCSFEKQWGFRSLYGYGMIDIYNDLDRVVCMLDGQDFAKCYTIGQALEAGFEHHKYGRQSSLNYVESRYFEIRFYKKGTVHLVWKDEKLWQTFNVTASRGKRWLGSDTQSEPEPEAPTPPMWCPARPETNTNSAVALLPEPEPEPEAPTPSPVVIVPSVERPMLSAAERAARQQELFAQLMSSMA